MTKEERTSFLKSIFPEKKGFNGYFNAVGIVYRIAEFAFLFLFLGFLAISALGNLSGITYANAEYLFRNFSVTLSENRTEATELVYNPDTQMSFAAVGKGLAVCGNTGVSLFSATGRNTCTDVREWMNPCVRASGKYTLVFESGGTSYAVYGPYSLLYTGTAEYPIRGASIADDGTYALISGAEGYTSAVTVYDTDFSAVCRYLKSSYAVSAELDASGKKLVLTTLGTDADGAYRAEVSEYTVGKKETDSVRSYTGLFPLQSRFTEDTVFTVFSDRLLRCEDGREQHVSFDGAAVSDLCISDGAASVLLSETGGGTVRYRVVHWDRDGHLHSSSPIAATYCRMTMCGGRTFLLTEEGLRVFEGDDMGEVQLIYKPFSAETRLVPYSADKVYLAGKSAAYLIEVK